MTSFGCSAGWPHLCVSSHCCRSNRNVSLSCAPPANLQHTGSGQELPWPSPVLVPGNMVPLFGCPTQKTSEGQKDRGQGEAWMLDQLLLPGTQTKNIPAARSATPPSLPSPQASSHLLRGQSQAFSRGTWALFSPSAFSPAWKLLFSLPHGTWSWNWLLHPFFPLVGYSMARAVSAVPHCQGSWLRQSEGYQSFVLFKSSSSFLRGSKSSLENFPSSTVYFGLGGPCSGGCCGDTGRVLTAGSSVTKHPKNIPSLIDTCLGRTGWQKPSGVTQAVATMGNSVSSLLPKCWARLPLGLELAILKGREKPWPNYVICWSLGPGAQLGSWVSSPAGISSEQHSKELLWHSCRRHLCRGQRHCQPELGTPRHSALPSTQQQAAKSYSLLAVAPCWD